jgi:WD40 repeat protein
MGKLFINYRRDDAGDAAGRLSDYLVNRFGREHIFLDVDGIDPGRDFREVINELLSQCDVMIGVVGTNWLDCKDEEGNRRLDDPGDFVRMELATALKRKIPVIPVRVQGAALPKPAQLPDDLKDFAWRNAVELTQERWNSDVQSLMEKLSRYMADPDSTSANVAQIQVQSECPEVEIADVCPYRGLLPFTEADSGFFFGRDELVEELKEHLRRNPKLLAIIGSSGSGKSSVVQAGLIPRLREIPGFERSRVVYFRPGAAPLDAMRQALIASQISLEPDVEVREMVDQFVAVSRETRLVLLADQFEEAFALTLDSERVQFITCMCNLIDGISEVTLILTLRADFYDQLLRSQLGQRVKFGQVTVLPMSDKELGSAITKPAESIGLLLEPGLAERILEECADIEQPLPLVEFALTQLWESRENGFLTHRAYGAIGRVAGALGRWATEAYEGSVSSDGDLVRRTFTSLVHFGKSGAPDTRRRLSLEELASISPDPDSVRRVVMNLASRRLVVTDRDPLTGKAYVEIVHDALLSEWPQLQLWIREDHPFLSWRQWLEERIQEWNEKQQDPGALLRGKALTEAQQLLSNRAVDLSQPERRYIELSQQLQSQEQARLEQLNIDALRGREQTLHERQVSLARLLASESEAIRTQQPELVERSVLLALESIKRFRTVEGDQALRRGLDLLPRAIARVMHNDEVRCLAFSPNNRFLATGGNDNAALVTEVQTGRGIARVVHLGDVTSVHFSPDSRLLASSSIDCTVRISELMTGKPMFEVSHDFQVYSVEFSPNGSMIATASMDNTARLWRIQDRKELARFTHKDQVRTAKFSPDGSLLATASWDSSCRVWEVSSGKEVSFFLHGDRVLAVAFSPDGHFLVTGSMDRTARVWDLAERKELRRVLHAELITDVAVSMNGKLLASASWDGTARIWDIASGTELMRFTHDGNVYAVAFSRDGRFVATAGVDKTARLFNAITGGEVARMAHGGRLHAIAFSHDSKMLASAGADDTAHVWEIGKGPATPLMVHEDGLYDLKFSPDGNVIATASMDATARVWESATGRELRRLVHDAGVNAIAFSGDGRLLATACMDCNARVWDAMTGDQIFRAEHDLQVYAVDFSQDRRFVASCSMDRTARIWDTATGQETGRFQHSDQINSVKFSTSGRFLLTASLDSTARVWEVSTGREMACFPHKEAVRVADFNRNGTFVVTGSADRTARIWDASTGQEIACLHHEDLVCAISLSPDERTLATASWDRTARIWSFPTGTELGTLRHERQVCALGFDPKGDFLATASWDRTARIWELLTGQEIARLGHDERINAVVFSPDGRFVATASMDCTARLRLWQTPDLIAYARGLLTRNLTDEERELYLASESRSDLP